MARLEEPGIFRGRIVESGIAFTSKQGLPQFRARLITTERYDPLEQEWEQFDDGEVTAFILLKQTERNGWQFENLSKALGYGGGGLVKFLGETDFSKVTVQFVTKEETYQDQQRISVQTIRPSDHSLGMQKASAEQISEVEEIFVDGIDKPEPVEEPVPAVAESDIPF